MNTVRKISIVIIIIANVGCFNTVQAQNNKIGYTNGFHLGATGEGQVFGPFSVVPFGADYPEPIFKNGLGWKVGLELSYHFCDYFGVSVGADYGSIFNFNPIVYLPYSQYFSDGVDKYDTNHWGSSVNRFQLTIKVEFHFPFKNTNIMFCAAIGTNLLNIWESINYSKTGVDFYSTGWEYNADMSLQEQGGEGTEEAFHCVLLEDKAYKIRADLVVNLGICYRLPYLDIIRATAVFNYAFKDCLRGYYDYSHGDSWGAVSYRHNYIGLEIAYIHCFKPKGHNSDYFHSKDAMNGLKTY